MLRKLKMEPTEASKKKPSVDIYNIPAMDKLMHLQHERFKFYVRKGKTEEEANGMLDYRSQTVRQFTMQQFELLETKDKAIMNKATRVYGRMNLLAVTGAIAANIALKPLTNGKIFDWPKWARVGIRSTLFAVPLGYTLYNTWTYYRRLNLYIEEKYSERIVEFMET
jgi:hypothetical protein